MLLLKMGEDKVVSVWIFPLLLSLNSREVGLQETNAVYIIPLCHELMEKIRQLT
jgi:hypothetical protein